MVNSKCSYFHLVRQRCPNREARAVCRKKSGGETGLVGSVGRKYCDAVKCWRFEILPRVTNGKFAHLTLDRQAKHQYSAASGAQARCDKASGDRIGRI
jgi:hypothetical protein